MKTFSVLVASVVVLSCAVFGVNGDLVRARLGSSRDSSETRDLPNASAQNQGEPAPLIVHEWGTFTSFSGSDGVNLEFRPLLENDLPSFVFNRVGRSAIPFFSAKSTLTALQRMETPVTYFYTPIERDVSVKVEFPDGLLTEYYPPVRSISPEAKAGEWFTTTGRASFETAGQIKNSMLDWGQIHLIPTASLRARVDDEELSRRIGRHVETSLVPTAGRQFIHYVAARETDSAIVQFRYEPNRDDQDAAWSPWNAVSTDKPVDYFEKFLFYRGVGNFELPLTLSETDDQMFELVNSGKEEIRSLFLVTVEGESVRFHRYDRIAAGDLVSLTLSTETSSIDALAEEMVASLHAEGLYEKEARAMVKCWRSSWFGEEGTRLLYMVPQSLTDELLPLHVEPEPDETVRVLVGRMEIMPQALESRVLLLMEQSSAARLSTAKKDRPAFESPSLEALLTMGRLAEPALIRARHITSDEQLQAEASRLITELRSATH